MAIAAGCGILSCIKVLVAAGADVNKPNFACNRRETPLHQAAMRKNYECCEYLVVEG